MMVNMTVCKQSIMTRWCIWWQRNNSSAMMYIRRWTPLLAWMHRVCRPPWKHTRIRHKRAPCLKMWPLMCRSTLPYIVWTVLWVKSACDVITQWLWWVLSMPGIHTPQVPLFCMNSKYDPAMLGISAGHPKTAKLVNALAARFVAKV